MNFLLKLFVKNNDDLTNDKVRESCGKKAGVLGIILNTLLATGKIVIGAISGAVSVLADGLNNLTDCGSNVVSIIGFKMSGKPADKEHPFGHQRAETVSALLVSMLILVVAFEVAKESIGKILNPEIKELSTWLIIILSISVVVKLFMFFVNRTLGKATNSSSLLATSVDSLSDSVATLVVLIAFIISHFTGVQLDGYAGVLVAIFICFSGIGLLKETVSHLLGKAPDQELVESIKQRVFAYKNVHGIHDLAVHNYGPNKLYATVHVEIDSQMPIMASHDLADAIEKDFADNTNILLTVHIDPLVLNDPIVNAYREGTEKAIESISPTLSIHDFRVVGGETHTNLVFDIAVPFDYELSNLQLEELVKEKVKDNREDIGVVCTIERQNQV